MWVAQYSDAGSYTVNIIVQYFGLCKIVHSVIQYWRLCNVLRNSDFRRATTLYKPCLPERHILITLTESDLCCSIIAVAASRNKKGKKKGFKKKVRKWPNSFVDREKYTQKLLNALRVIESNDFCHFVRMNIDLLDKLFALVAPEIEKNRNLYLLSCRPWSLTVEEQQRSTVHDRWRDTDRILRNATITWHNFMPVAQYIFSFLNITQYIAKPFNIAHTQSIILHNPKYCAIILSF